MRPFLIITTLSFLAVCVFSACSIPRKEALNIRTNGFLDDNRFQAILVFDPDPFATGLVAMRESAYLKAKNADLKEMTLESVALYCIDFKLQTDSVNKRKQDALIPPLKNEIRIKLKNITGDGSISFAYYNEKNSLLIGYSISREGLKEKVNALASSLELNSGE